MPVKMKVILVSLMILQFVVSTPEQVIQEYVSLLASNINRMVEETGPTPQQTIQSLETKFAFNFNKGDYKAMADAYNPGAMLIPPTADAFIPQSGLAEFFEKAAESGLKDLDLKTKVVNVENPNLYHEIGTWTSNGSNDEQNYYVRWIRLGDEQPWQIAFDIMVIGEKAEIENFIS